MKIKTVGIITYHYSHLKTEQIMERLLSKEYAYKIYALPFIKRKPRDVLFSHRPEQSNAVAPQVIAKKHSIPYFKCLTDKEIDNSCDIYLILGAGILSPDCVANKRIINCHGGIIPATRGLDSFKWALYKMNPLGVTLHYIDEKVDAGKIISVIPTDVYASDSLSTLARRHYENEIDCLSRFDYFLKNPQNKYLKIKTGKAEMRMPLEKEKKMISKFHKYVKKYQK